MDENQGPLRPMPDELTLADGTKGKIKLLGSGVLECHCSKCKGTFWVKSNTANCCPTCMDTNVKMVWTTPLVAFIPQRLTEEGDG